MVGFGCLEREGVPLIVIQRQLGHTNLGITSIYLQGIDNAEIIDTVHARRAPMIAVSTSLRLQSRVGGRSRLVWCRRLGHLSGDARSSPRGLARVRLLPGAAAP